MPDQPAQTDQARAASSSADTQSSASAAAGNYLAVQHIALQRFLTLSAEIAGQEHARIEKQYATERGRLGQFYDTLLTRIEQTLHESDEKVGNHHDAMATSVREQYDAQIELIQAEYERRCRRTNDETENALRDARKNMEQDSWLADSVYEASREQLVRQREKLEAQVPGLFERLDQVEQRGDWLLREMCYQPAGDAGTAAAGACDASNATTDQAEPAEDAAVAVQESYERSLERLEQVESLSTPRLVIGATPYVLAGIFCAVLVGLAGIVDYFSSAAFLSFYWLGPVGLALGAILSTVGIRALRRISQTQLHAAAVPLQCVLEQARHAVDRHVTAEHARIDKAFAHAAHRREVEVGRAQEQFARIMADLETARTGSLAKLEDTLNRATTELRQQCEAHLQRLDHQHQVSTQRLRDNHQRLTARLTARRDREITRVDARQHGRRRELTEQWQDGIERLKHLLQEGARIDGLAPAWDTVFWQSYQPTRTFMPQIPFGRLGINLSQLAECVLERTSFNPQKVTSIGHADGLACVPAALELPEHCSLLVQTGLQGRVEALAALQAVMARLLTSLPAGRAHFTILDPVGLGENFAGFMHLADYDDALIGGRIWTEKQHIEQRLGDLTAHMENVIQKYLRNEFETIDAYNVQAGELAEPYRFLVIADFPANFTEEALRRLSSIVISGPRCGVYTLIVQDTRMEVLPCIQMEDLQQAAIHIRYEDGRFVWQDDVRGRFVLTLDAPPDQDTLTSLMHRIGQAAGRAKRVEVPFEFITPPADQFWTADASSEIRVPVGRTGAVRLQELRLGRGVAQHALIAGKTGSGKSTLLHVLITNLVMWYSPDEVEFYLIDFKKGVEFKTYAAHELPHARAIAIESDREFGLSVLQRLDAEMERRGELFRAAGVQDLAGYRSATKARMPRTLLVVDEFQVFFSEDDKLAQDASILLDRLVRQGRAFGIHVLLGSQTLGGTSGLPRSTIGQMAVRIALQCSELDSQLIFDDGNSAARLLSRPGEAIYNDAGGLLQGNSPFQTAWLSDEERDVYLDRVTNVAQSRPVQPESQFVFEVNAPADLRRNRQLMSLLSSPQAATSEAHAACRVFLGEAVAIKDPTAAVFRRQSGAHLLLIGQRDDAALAIMSAAMIGLAAQHRPTSAEFVILDGSSSESPHIFQHVAAALPQRSRFVEYRHAGEVIAELAAELQHRQADGTVDGPAVFVFIYGLQRYRMLRRTDDFSFSFSSTEENAPPPVDKQFAELLREGPAVGIHVIAWGDTPATIERCFDRQAMREFDNRVLFQMSASDSSNLIDSPMANRLGFYRALFYSEEQGLLEKFRPYSLPDRAFLEELGRLNGHGANG